LVYTIDIQLFTKHGIVCDFFANIKSEPYTLTYF
jgi:hypothetical protein